MKIIRFAQNIDTIYNKCNTKEFLLTLVALFVFLYTTIPHDRMPAINFMVLLYLLTLFITHKLTKKSRDKAPEKNQNSLSNHEDCFHQNTTTKYIEENKTKKEAINVINDTIPSKKRTYTIAPAPAGELSAEEVAKMLGLTKARLGSLRKFTKEAIEYGLSVNTIYGPKWIQRVPNGVVTYKVSEIKRHQELIENGTLQYITAQQHNARIDNMSR